MSSAALSHGVRTKPRHPGVAPALKALSLSSLGDAMAGSVTRSNRLASDAGIQRKSVSDVANDGFQGAGTEVPYRSEMEQSFGRDFSGVRAHTGSSAAGANDKLGANAYAMGSQIAFKSASPSKDLVAHELTHVVQQEEGGPQYHGRDDIDTSGEGQAESVESAVRAGRPASSVLSPATKSSGPARKKNGRGPAREGGGFVDKFSMGMQFSKDGFEKSYEYTIWDKNISMPIPACPVINMIVKPAVKVAVKGGADWGGENKGTGKVSVEITGSVGVGLSGGIANVAEVYAVVEPGITGIGEFRFGNSKWSLDVGMALKVGGKVGVALGGGILDYAFQLFDLELLKFTGLNWDQDGFHKEKLGIGMGKDIEGIFKAIKAIIDKAKAAGSAIADGAVKTGKYIASGAKEAYDFLTSW